MARNECDVEWTCYVPKSGHDATNYILLGTQIKIAAHEDVPLEHLHFVVDLRDIIGLHKQHTRSEVAKDGSVRRSTKREVLNDMEDLLQRLDAAGLRLGFRMWSIHSRDELVRIALREYEAIDTDGNFEEGQRQSDDNRFGAIVAFLIVPDSLPVLIPDSGNGHTEICVTQLPDWESLHDELEE